MKKEKRIRGNRFFTTKRRLPFTRGSKKRRIHRWEETTNFDLDRACMRSPVQRPRFPAVLGHAAMLMCRNAHPSSALARAAVVACYCARSSTALACQTELPCSLIRTARAATCACWSRALVHAATYARRSCCLCLRTGAAAACLWCFLW